MQASQQQQQQQQQQARKRLKDTCNSCALSKVKCSRDRPSCTRCEDRGIYCYYSPSQRSGRRSAPSSVGAAPAVATIRLPNGTPNFDYLNTPPSSTVAGFASDMSPFPEFPKDHYNGDTLPLWGSGVVTGLHLNGSGFDTEMTSALDYAVTGNNDFESPIHCSNGMDLQSSTNSHDMNSFLSSLGQPNHSAQSTPFSLHETRQNPFFVEKQSTTDKPHSCLNLALNILPSLHHPPPTCTLASVLPGERNSSQLPTVDYVISTNKAFIDSVTIMLSCSCSLDEQVASILSLIASKIMAWYAAAARDADGNESSCQSTIEPSERVLHLPTTIGKYQLDGVDRRRMRAQLILSELHRVVRLVELLSKRFEEARLRTEDKGTNTHNSHDWISASTFVRLEADLRTRLRAVTKETIAILRG